METIYSCRKEIQLGCVGETAWLVIRSLGNTAMAPSVLLTKVVRAAAAGVVITILPLLALLISRGPKRIDSGPDAGQGMWGAKTASANWCEADYVVTPWIAEFWNSMSSLLIVVHSMYGLYRHAWACEARYGRHRRS